MNYHEKALRDLEVAKNYNSAQGNPSNDEGLYDIAAYHAQQAIEKELKHILHDVFGADETERKFKTHTIPALISQAEEYGVCVPDNVKAIAYDITAWEAKTRYPGGAKSNRDDINEAIQIYEEFSGYVKDNIDNIRTEGKTETGQEEEGKDEV